MLWHTLSFKIGLSLGHSDDAKVKIKLNNSSNENMNKNLFEGLKLRLVLNRLLYFFNTSII